MTAHTILRIRPERPGTISSATCRSPPPIRLGASIASPGFIHAATATKPRSRAPSSRLVTKAYGSPFFGMDDPPIASMGYAAGKQCNSSACSGWLRPRNPPKASLCCFSETCLPNRMEFPQAYNRTPRMPHALLLKKLQILWSNACLLRHLRDLLENFLIQCAGFWQSDSRQPIRGHKALSVKNPAI